MIHNGFAQTTKIAAKDTTLLDQTTSLMLKMDSMHRADSLRKVALIKEIEILKGSEANKQRQMLLTKLKEQEVQDSTRKAKQLAQLEVLKSNAVGYPVAPFSDTLFMIHTAVGSFSPSDRATSVNSRIESLYDNYEFKPDSLRVTVGETSSEIIFKDMVVMSVNELEALWFDKKSGELAREYCDRLKMR